MRITAKKVQAPKVENVTEVVQISEATMEQRRARLIEVMKQEGFSSVIVYADKEHGGNFEYLTGFIPRFEEGLQIFNIDGSSTLILGNENFNKVGYSRTKSAGIKCSLFSLPNQPINDLSEMQAIMQQATIDTSGKVGIVGWKVLPGMTKDYDMPAFIVRAIQTVVPEEKLFNGTYLYIDPSFGARIVNNANEMAHYEYGASLASDSVLNAMNALEVGMTEQEAGNYLQVNGFYPNVVTISTFGDRFIGANLYPTARKLEEGDKVALTISYRGGLSSRNSYAVKDREQLELADPGYFEEVVLPYYRAYHFWLTNMKLGVVGGDFYRDFKAHYPQETYGWELNPGHLTANEEWMSSPLYEDSTATIQSGMIFQVDFIPIQKGHNGVSAESTVAIADEALRTSIAKEYPALWARIVERRAYMKNELGIDLAEELLPLAGTLAYYRPFLLDKETALVVDNG